MDFGVLPPEVTSIRMYSGPGSAPMLAAASAWSGLAAELTATADDYETIVARLQSEDWIGPAATSMAGAVQPYVAWMRATAAQAEQTATQARMLVAAYEAAVAAVVPPPLVAGNRAQVALLVSTNVFGQNTSRVALLEAEYGDMWTQDATAMYVYAAASANASRLTPFTSPTQTTSPSASAWQGAAVAKAAGTAAGGIQNLLSKLVSQAPNALLDLATPLSSLLASAGAAPTPPTWVVWLEDFLNLIAPLTGTWYNVTGLPYFGIGITNSLASTARAVGAIGPEVGAAAASAGGAAADAAGTLGRGAPIAAGMGNAPAVGKLSVPPGWSATGPVPVPSVGSVSAPLVSNIALPEAASESSNMLGGMPLAGPGVNAAGSAPRYGFRPKVMVRPPFAG
ncbi:PPE family protein [Mycobacterium kansasii]|uniref:PPE family protein n=1 Tax=Mycobacterium kansasii TaxID=1768 RepID=UPI0004F7C402|nr:PPE family protein [Mycobacterium kansasii]ARG59661.1 PPE family protein [Mycobacterium kansasii]ARG65126.1 PPE family protein [Mycobacterium kansasii]ARG72879.1 PPE family protein [Mycobacterium kansasii]ARG78120.1 PPE family protein [Mycobacterium kansasii]ARG83565.1 PPE family protein [Mycobacterium kansasii]